jgi:hypothetical protein
MNDAVMRKFGRPLAPTPGYTALALVDQSTAQLKGDSALLVRPGQKDQGTIAIRKDGKWYLDLNHSLGGDLAASTKLHQAIASAAREVATNTDAARYAKIADVEAAFRAALGTRVAPAGHAGSATSRP